MPPADFAVISSCKFHLKPFIHSSEEDWRKVCRFAHKSSKRKALKTLFCICQLQRVTPPGGRWVSPFCPARRVASPWGGCGSCPGLRPSCRGEARAEAVAEGGPAAHSPSRALPCNPAGCLSSLPSPLHPACRGFGSFSPLPRPPVPAQHALLLATAVASVLRSWPLQGKSWLRRPCRASSYIHNCKTLSDFKKVKGSGCARLVGR